MLMKNNILYMVGALFSSAILAFGCSDDDVPSYSEITVDKNEVFIQADSDTPTAEVNILNGNGNYKITVADENIATASLEGTHITFTGIKNGSTTATVMDWTKHSTVITLKVKEDFDLKLDKSELIMIKDVTAPQVVSIMSGNGGYQVESSLPEVAAAELTTEDKVQITALTVGIADITVTDADGKKATVKVTVADGMLELEDVSGRIWGIGETSTLDILSGNGEYKVASDNEAVATAEIIENTVSVTGHAEGEANITVTDKMGLTATATIKVRVGPSLETTVIDKLWIGEDQEIAILGGSGDYSIETSSKAIEGSVAADNTKLIISGKESAINQTVTFTDNIFGMSIEIKVKWMDYPFDTYKARWFIDGDFGVPAGSIFDTKEGREYLSVGKTKKVSGKTVIIEGFVVSFEGGREVGSKTNATLHHLDASGNAIDAITITDLRIEKTEQIDASGDGKYWIKFREEGKDEDSYIVTWT